MKATNPPARFRRIIIQVCARACAAGLVILLSALGRPGELDAQEAYEGRLFEGPGATLHYEVIGDGPGTPLVVVNGGPGFNHTYLHLADEVWQRLSQRRPVVFYDQRGNGRSPALEPDQSSTLADQIADLDGLRGHLGYPRIALVGHSWGGYLSMAYTARHPERVERLVLVGSAAPDWSETIFLFEHVFPETVERRSRLAFEVALGDSAASERDIQEYLTMLFVSESKRDAFLAGCQDCAFDREVYRRLNADIGRFDLGPELATFDLPVLVTTGRYDINVAPAVAYRIHQAIPGSRFVVFEKSGHIPFYEEPERFARVVEEFLGSN